VRLWLVAIFHKCVRHSYVSAAARINARQATSTRVAFSDDEDAGEPKATSSSWQPKGKLVTPAKPKVNPIPSTTRGPKGSMPWSDAVCIFPFMLHSFCRCHPFIRCVAGSQSSSQSHQRVRIRFLGQNEEQVQIFNS
jgi:hypothetical protein